MSRNHKLYYEINSENINSEIVIKFLDKFSNNLSKKTVVIMDQASIHTSDAVIEKLEEWPQKNLEIFWLPTYSPKLNLIEILKIKFMRLGIMQPYFFPYLGYFQLINTVDTFIIYDNIKFTKKGWINRNRYLINGKDHLFSLPLKKDHDFLEIKDRYLADGYDKEKKKILARIKCAYIKAPYFKECFSLVQECLDCDEKNLFKFIFYSIKQVCTFLQINTPLIISSQVKANHNLKGQDRVINICKAMKANHYINPPGGRELYDRDVFQSSGIELSFLQPGTTPYNQGLDNFIPNLSIIDVLMCNSPEDVQKMVKQYELSK